MSSKVSVSIWWKNLLPAEKFMLVAAGVFGLLVLLGLLIFLPVGKVINKVSEDKVTKGYSKMVPDWVRGGWAYQRVVKYTQHGSFPKNTGSVIIPKALAILNKSVSQHVKDRWVFNKVPNHPQYVTITLKDYSSKPICGKLTSSYADLDLAGMAGGQPNFTVRFCVNKLRKLVNWVGATYPDESVQRMVETIRTWKRAGGLTRVYICTLAHEFGHPDWYVHVVGDGLMSDGSNTSCEVSEHEKEIWRVNILPKVVKLRDTPN